MPRPLRLPFAALLLFPAFLRAQTSPDMARILERLDRLERQNQELLEELRSLRAELGSARAEPPAVASAVVSVESEAAQPPAAPATVEQKLDIQQHRIDEQAQSKVEASQRFPIRLTGMALFNAFVNSNQSGGFEYPTIASATGPAHDGATVRQTIIGLEYQGPETFWGGHVRGSVYMDFDSGSAPLDQTIRLRTGSMEIDWATRSIMVGVEKPIFNPLEPSSLAQVGVSPLTGTGNLWLWMPQVRLEQDFALGTSSGIRARMGVVETSEAGPYAGSDPIGAVEANRPGLEGRFEFFHRLDDERRLEVAPGFHISTTHAGGYSIPSQVFSVDWLFRPVAPLEFTGAYFRGQNVAPLGTGLIRQGFTIYEGQASAINSQGGWGQLTIHAARRLDFHLFTGQQDDQVSQLNPGAIGKNLLFGGNVFYRIAPNVLLGWEASQVRTSYLGQGIRINNHYDLALGYLF
jgi:hypothetical protein